MISIYNTLTNQKEQFNPINPGKVKMYVCGPTVYDYFHIGNARSFIMSDIIRRYLEYAGYDVTFVMNLTDIDDKIIKRANNEGVLSNIISEKFSGAFLEDIKKLKMKPATLYPKATTHIQDIIDMIKKLEEKGFAYNINGNVFYNVEKFVGYGKLSGKNIDDLISGARIEINEEKKNPLDFSLWKKAKEGEPWWESPWGKGRPGWHIECSAMSCKHLGETFDIHAGGNDLIFPHHENEIAQSEGATGKKFVNYWIHFGFLNINDEKMSKSLGNFFTAREIIKKYPAEALRMLYAQTHYGGPLNFSEDLLVSAQKGWEKINNLSHKINTLLKSEIKNDNEITFNFEEYYNRFSKAMNDDFNTPQAVAVIYDFVRDFNRALTENENPNSDFILKGKEFLSKTAEGVLGLIDFEGNKGTSPQLENELIELFIKLRIEAKKDKNYSLSDKIRDELKTLGILLEDSKDGTTYKKIKVN